MFATVVDDGRFRGPLKEASPQRLPNSPEVGAGWVTGADSFVIFRLDCNDTVKSEMDDFVAEMKKKGKYVEYTVLKDVGHGVARPEAQKKVVEGTVRFFKSQMTK